MVTSKDIIGNLTGAGRGESPAYYLSLYIFLFDWGFETMIVEMRYHVASLVAVFLALGLGIVLGANLGRTVNLQMEKQIDRLEQMYQKNRVDLQTSLQAKENELEIANQFQRAIIPNLIANRLLGKRIAIIRTNDSINFKYAKGLYNLLRQAGAEVTSITTIAKIVNTSDPQFKTELVDAFDISMSQEKDLFPQIAARMVQIISQGQGGFQLFYLQNKELVQLWGDYNRGYIDTIIFFGGGVTPESNHQVEIDQPLLDAARKIPGMTLIGVEPSFSTQSYMRVYQMRCQGTIDHIETSPGELSVVLQLASGKRGFYGIKDTARRLMPEFSLP
jgi:uncharacterized membrane protein YciS (DUF1049 family)